jgi:octaprenyl-diphosphate synthase
MQALENILTMIPSPQRSQPVSLSTLLAPQLEAVNTCLFEKMKSAVHLIPEVAGYLVSLGGKRLRPLLTVATAELCGYQGDRHIQLAACVEFIHTATLLHDDVVDESFLRRGMPSANAKWSNPASVLVGDFLFSRAFELMVADGSFPILKILSKASSTIIEGEIMQLSASHNLHLDEKAYLDIIEAKTACLFSAATRVGAVVANASETQQDHLAHFGHFLGLAFQLMDDVLDYTADQEKLGKQVGDDFREGKVTFPVIIAYKEGTDNDFWEEAILKGSRDEKMLTQATDILKRTGALMKTQQLAQHFIDKAIAQLESFPNSHLKTALQDLAYFSVYREN